MAIIKKFTFFQKSKIKDLTPFVGQNFFGENLIHDGVYLLNYMLPLKFKFTKEAFIALEDKKGKGLIELQKETGKPTKLRITKFFLEKDSFDVGEQLINYVISRYCAYGANSFYIVFNEELNEMASLFINSCKFRVGAYETIYKINQEHLEKIDKRGLTLCNFKPFQNAKASILAEAYNNSIMPHLRPIFGKNKRYFTESFTSGYFKRSHFIYTLENQNNEMCGYLNLNSINDIDYILDISLSPSYESYLMDSIYFIAEEIKKRHKKWNLYIKIKHYFSTSNQLISQSEEYGFEFINKNIILVKDFFKPLKQDIFQNAKILFSDINPIYKQKT